MAHEEPGSTAAETPPADGRPSTAAIAAGTIEIVSRAGDSALRMVMVERLSGDGELAVEVVSEGFRGVQNVWFQAYEVSRFVTELERFGREGKGSVNLRSMSPDKFTLDFMPFSNKRAVLVTIRLQRHGFWGEPRYAQSLFVAFEWEPTGIPGLVAQLRALLGLLAQSLN